MSLITNSCVIGDDVAGRILGSI